MDEKVKYLNYWWLKDSEIDPATATEEYFRVTYDTKGRYILVERLDVRHRLLSSTRFIWRNRRLNRVESYDASGKMQRYRVYRYGIFGMLLGTDEYSPDGELLRFSPNEP